MDITRQLLRSLVLFLTAISVLFAGTAAAFTSVYAFDVPSSLSAPDGSERENIYYRSPLKTFEEQNVAVLSQSTPSARTAYSKEAVPSFGTYVKEFAPDVVGGTERIFSKDNVPLVLIGVGLTGLALTVDQRVKKYFQDRKPLEHVESIGNTIGSGYPEVGLGLALLGTGELVNDKKMADTGVVSLEASLLDGIATESLKYATMRKRPNGGARMSFPSGHASITATFAASISEMYDWDLRLAVPLYLTTAFVGASRIQANEHFFSDVIAGITVGTVVGVSVAKYHKEKDAKSGLQNISISPLFDKDLRGCVITLKFL